MFEPTEKSSQPENKALEAHPTGEEIEQRAYQIYLEAALTDTMWMIGCKPNVNCQRSIRGRHR